MPTPVVHKLIRDGAPEPRHADNRQRRPVQRYACSCGTPLPGESRRQALPHHRTHRAYPDAVR